MSNDRQLRENVLSICGIGLSIAMCNMGLPGLVAQCSMMRFGSLRDGSREMAESERRWNHGGGINYAKHKQSFVVEPLKDQPTHSIEYWTKLINQYSRARAGNNW